MWFWWFKKNDQLFKVECDTVMTQSDLRSMEVVISEIALNAHLQYESLLAQLS